MRATADRRIVMIAIVFAILRGLLSVAPERRVDLIANDPHPAFGHLLPRGEGITWPLSEITTLESVMSDRETSRACFDVFQSFTFCEGVVLGKRFVLGVPPRPPVARLLFRGHTIERSLWTGFDSSTIPSHLGFIGGETSREFDGLTGCFTEKHWLRFVISSA